MHRLLVIGTGSIGERHVRCLLATGRAEVGVCEPRENVCQDVSRRYAVCGAFAALDDALIDTWDAAVIATPAHTHVRLARQLAAAGIHLLIEKPLSVGLDDVTELLAEVRAQKLVARVGYTYRAHPGLVALKRAIDSGRLGDPLELVFVAGQPFPRFRPGYQDTYFANRAHGGGAIQDALTHFVDLGQWLVGPVDRLLADADHQALTGVDVEDTVHLLARHGPVMAGYCLNMYQAPNELSLTVVGSRATGRFELHRCRWRWMTEPDGPWHDEPTDLKTRDDWFTLQEHAFLDALEGKATHLCTLPEAVAALRVNLAIVQACAEQTSWQILD